jgi:hypothetical protein
MPPVVNVVDTGERLDRWRAITALSRLAERTDDDVGRSSLDGTEHRLPQVVA